jgi:hypothetical protein
MTDNSQDLDYQSPSEFSKHEEIQKEETFNLQEFHQMIVKDN